jgi:hypothetical protein
MPCTDQGADEAYEQEQRRTNTMVKALACAAFKLLEEEGLLTELNWTEAGVSSKDGMRWWSDHKTTDAERKAAQAQALKDKRDRKLALKKLTARERKLLEVK